MIVFILSKKKPTITEMNGNVGFSKNILENILIYNEKEFFLT